MFIVCQLVYFIYLYLSLEYGFIRFNGRKSDYNNYRPIAILPVVEKVLEVVIVIRLTSFLKKYKIINKNQFGFQKDFNINKLLGNFSNLINSCMSKHLHCLVSFVDFSKAFDTLTHYKC